MNATFLREFFVCDQQVKCGVSTKQLIVGFSLGCLFSQHLWWVLVSLIPWKSSPLHFRIGQCQWHVCIRSQEQVIADCFENLWYCICYPSSASCPSTNDVSFKTRIDVEDIYRESKCWATLSDLMASADLMRIAHALCNVSRCTTDLMHIAFSLCGLSFCGDRIRACCTPSVLAHLLGFYSLVWCRRAVRVCCTGFGVTGRRLYYPSA